MMAPDFGIGRSASRLRHYGAGPFYPFPRRWGKLGPVVEVDTPEGEAAVRRAYPWDRPTVVRSYRGESLGDPGVENGEVFTISIAVAAVGILLGYLSFHHQKSPLGMIALGAAGSITGTSIVLLIRDMIKSK